jgi:hypothetical protein
MASTISQHGRSGYAAVPQKSALFPSSKAKYRLKRYLWRSFLTIAGPLMVLAFYTFICFHFLVHPLSNNIFPSTTVSAVWAYYGWLLISVFIMEWARSGLANIEASALMMPHLAPSTAGELMWHADTNWANPLWWFRAMFWSFPIPTRPQPQGPVSRPGVSWILLSSVHILLFLAIPLSGLSMEVVDASAYAKRAALVYGPNASSFNSRMYVDFPPDIRRNWLSGRQTSPAHGGLLYAPQGTKNVSTTYFEDEAMAAARNANGNVIRVFAGPAVREPIWGEAWGLSANISCVPTPLDELQMIKSDAFTTSVNGCSTKKGCEFQWLNTDEAIQLNDVEERSLNIPVWFNESHSIDITYGFQFYSLLVAADGWSTTSLDISSNATKSPYNNFSNHDEFTFDHIVNGVTSDDVTNSMFEMALWQAGASVFNTVDDEIFKSYKKDPSRLITVRNGTTDLFRNLGAGDDGVFVGLGVHCDIKSAVGNAILDPDRRAFSNFTRDKAAPNSMAAWIPFDVAPVQIQAMASIAGNQYFSNINNPLTSRNVSSPNSILAGAHMAIGSTMLPRAEDHDTNYFYYPTLTTENLTLAIYKLLGESVISLMSDGGIEPWISSSLYTLKPAKYLRSGAVPWQLVLTLIAMWAISTSFGALYMVLFVGPRWAPTLSGFELFKFGAQYHDEVHQFEAVDFQSCTRSLTAIPGMVGMLPGNAAGGKNELGFIGLSQKVADRRRGINYTLDRDKAAKMPSV